MIYWYYNFRLRFAFYRRTRCLSDEIKNLRVFYFHGGFAVGAFKNGGVCYYL